MYSVYTLNIYYTYSTYIMYALHISNSVTTNFDDAYLRPPQSNPPLARLLHHARTRSQSNEEQTSGWRDGSTAGGNQETRASTNLCPSDNNNTPENERAKPNPNSVTCFWESVFLFCLCMDKSYMHLYNYTLYIYIYIHDVLYTLYVLYELCIYT